MIQFKNYGEDWIDLVDILQHDQFRELKDVDVYTNPLINNQYIHMDWIYIARRLNYD